MSRLQSRDSISQRLAVPALIGHYLVVVALLALLYLWSMPRLITLEDAGLFNMVCATGGIAHPPGYPLFTLLCHPVYLLPGISPIIAGNLVSIVFACATGVVLFRIALLLFDHIIFGYIAVLTLAVSAAFWSQAIIIEVYTLNTLLFSLLLLAALQFHASGRMRHLYLFALLFGLALTNHWPLILLSAPGLGLLLLPRLWVVLRAPGGAMRLALCCALLLVGLLPYLALLLNEEPPFSLYGPISGWEEFLKYIARSAYGDGTASSDWGDKLTYLLWLGDEVVQQYGWIGLIFITLGARELWLRHDRITNGALWLIFLGSTVVLLLLLNFDFSFRYRAVFKPFPLLAYIVLSLVLTQGIKAAAELLARPSHRLSVAALAGAAVTLVSFLAHAPINNRSAEALPDRYGRTVLASVDRDARILVQSDDQTGTLGYLHHIEGVRADVELYSRDNLVFANRLSSPFAPRSVQLERLNEMVSSSPVPVYSLTPLARPGVDYGLYLRYQGEERGFGFDPQLTAFLDHLLDAHEARAISDPHTRSLVHGLLLGFSRQYVGHSLSSHRSIDLSDDYLRRLERLQATFEGKLMLMDYLLHHNPYRMDKLALLDMAKEAELQMPEEITVVNRAALFQFIGNIFLMRSELYPPDYPLATLYVERSVDALPIATNESVCQLLSLYRRQNQEENLRALRERFEPGNECAEVP